MLPLVGICSVLCTWFLLTLVFLGCGLAVLRMLRLDSNGWRDAHLSFWVGWATTIVILQLWHLQFPVDDRILVAIALLGLTGLTMESKSLLKEVRQRWQNADRASLIRATMVAAIVLLFWAALAIGPPHRPDTANYHMAGVRWASQYPIVPGLGNLHHRLAFNNSSFLYAAMLDAGPWTHRSHHLAHGLLAVVTLLSFLSRVPLLRDTQSPRFPIHLMQATFFPIALLFTYKGTTSVQPDLITFLLGLVVASLLFELLFDRELSPQQTRLGVFGVCFLSSVALTVKLSFLVFGFVASCIAIGIQWRLHREKGAAFFGLATTCCIVAALAIAPWLGRHLILSGYALYPSPRISINVPWRVPFADAQLAHDSIVGYARHHGDGYLETLDNYDWIGPVILRELGHPVSVTIPLICVLATGLGWLVLRKRRVTFNGGRLCLFLMPAALAVLFMVFTAPCPRFAGASIWILAVGAMVGTTAQFDRASLWFQRNTRMIIALGIGLFGVGVTKASRYLQSPFGDTVFAPMPVGEVTEIRTQSGLPVFVSTGGAWDAPLPNTPEFRPNLALINEQNVRFGFRIVPSHSDATQIATRGDARRQH